MAILEKIIDKIERREWFELLYYIFLFYDLDENNDSIMYHDVPQTDQRIDRRILFKK